MSDGFLGFIFAGFALGVQYKFFNDFPFRSSLSAFALFTPIFMSLSGVSSLLIRSINWL